MQNSNTSQGRPPQLPHHQHLIRVEQVRKLPHLDDDAKAQHEVAIKRLWDVYNSHPPGSEQHTTALKKLSEISQSLMQQMKMHQQRKQQMAQAAQATSGPQRATQGSATNVSFNQLNPEIQKRVNDARFYFPPAMIPGTAAAEEWLKEAKARYGHALQRSEIARAKKAEFQRQGNMRESGGNPLTQQEREVYNNKVGQCDKAIQESESFMAKFKEQQVGFRQQTQARFTNPGPGGGGDDAATQTLSAGPGPTAHTIGSAVSAARSQATAQTSPQAANASISSSTPTQPTATTGINPSPYHPQLAQTDSSSSVPRPMVHPTQSATQPQSATHAHPPNYLNPAKKDERYPISKQLHVSSPKPIDMPPSRPTLTGGPNVGMAGQMAMPAISTYPGYVLEASENGRVLSKKKLNELVREVCGPGQEEQLTPEVEEVCSSHIVSIAYAFVASCRLLTERSSDSSSNY